MNRRLSIVACIAALSLLAFAQDSLGQCSGTDRVWDGSSNNTWSTSANWTDPDIPDTAGEDAIIVSAPRPTRVNSDFSVGCVEVQSGRIRCRNGRTLTILGDRFYNPVTGTLEQCDSAFGSTFFFEMAGTGPQDFTNSDELNNMRLSGNNTVTFTDAFVIGTQLLITGSTTTLKIQADLTLNDATQNFVIPSGTKVEVESGAIFTAKGGVTVNGTLEIKAGGTLVLDNGETLSVPSGGSLLLAGNSGNVAKITSTGAGATYTINIAGDINANYFRIDRSDAAGLNVSGTIQNLSNGEFHYIANAGYAVTLASTAVVPSDMDYLGFYDDDGHGNTKNIDATNFNDPGATELDIWSGDAGGAANETDPNGSIGWGTEAGTKLTISNNTASGSPPASVNQGDLDVLFATFAFALSADDTTTDITSLALTMSGTGASTDIEFVRIYKDTGGGTSCVYDSGVDTQVDTDKSVSGSPPKTTFTLSAGDLSPTDTTPVCIHVVADITNNAQDAVTIQFKVDQTADVVNSQGYNFSDTSGPPVSAGSATIIGDNVSKWVGNNNNDWNRTGNWRPRTVPTSTIDCQVASGVNIPVLNVNPASCQNATFPVGGELNFNNFELQISGALDVVSGYTFSGASSATLTMAGAASQVMKIRQEFPGTLNISNTGVVGNNVVSVPEASYIRGNVNVTSGVLRIDSGSSLTVGGNLVVSSGATLDIKGNASLILKNGSTVTINSGGTLMMVGSAGQISTMTSENTSSAYTVVVNGTIAADYYKFERLGTNGVTVSTTATIDGTNSMSNGSFVYPVNSSSTFLFLQAAVPGHTIGALNFDSGGSAATTITSINTTSGPSATLNITSYTGNWSGIDYDVEGPYALSWNGAATTLDLTQEATGPGSLNAGSTYIMGRYGFQQKDAGASYVDTDLTSLKLTLTGTGSASDVSLAKIYYDADCDNAGGTLLNSGTFSGNPASKTFSIAGGLATIEASASTPPLRCIYVEYDIAPSASNGVTLGVKINSATDVVDDQSYGISSGTLPPINLGTPGTVVGSTTTTWTGTTDTDWFTTGNWSAGVPDATKNCEIYNAANLPVIGNTATAVCKSLTLYTGSLTMQNGVGAALEIYGSFQLDNTFTQNDGTITIRDDGLTATSQNIALAGSSVGSISFNKTAGGDVKINSTNARIDNLLTIPSGASFEFIVPAGKTLQLPAGLNVAGGTFTINQSGTVQIGNGQSIAVAGGTFKINGINDGYEQTESTKGKVTVYTAGRWAFTSTSGFVDLTGFVFDNLDKDGIQIGGSTNLSSFSGGQIINMVQDWATPVKGLNLNTTGTVPGTASNVGFMWDDFNSSREDVGWCNCGPGISDNYYLVYAPACTGPTMNFDQWFGDFFVDVNQPVTEDKIYDTDDGGSCQIAMAASASPVSIVSFGATPFNNAVLLDWETGFEVNHLGFNVFRSLTGVGGWIQVNHNLVRNDFSGGGLHGEYKFLDTGVENGNTYYYYIEDVSIQGAKTWHGPVNAQPAASLSDPPEDLTSGSEDDPSILPVPESDPTIDLGHGVRILEKTLQSLRIEISMDEPILQAAQWDDSYTTVHYDGYSKSTEPGHPELPQRSLLIKVANGYANASHVINNRNAIAFDSLKISPAPYWTKTTKGMEPSYQIDSEVYQTNTIAPSSFIEVDEKLVKIGGDTFVRIMVHPVLYNAAEQNGERLVSITLDIGLDGDPWRQAPAIEEEWPPGLVANNIQLEFTETGMYRITYEDLVADGLEGPFTGQDVDQFRLYSGDTELPLEISSAGTFGPGDSITFYGIDDSTVHQRNTVYSLLPMRPGEATQPLRMTITDGDPTGIDPSSFLGTYASVRFENNWRAVFDRSLGLLEDHLYWTRIYVQEGTPESPADPNSVATATVSLPELISDNDIQAHIVVRLAGRGGNSINPILDLGLSVNGSEILTSKSFQSTTPELISFSISSAWLNPGNNSIQLQVLDDNLPPGDHGIIDVDHITVNYLADRFYRDSQTTVYNFEPGTRIDINGFPSNVVSLFDVSEPLAVSRMANFDLTSNDGGVTWDLETHTPAGPEDEYGFAFVAVEGGNYKSPLTMSFGHNTTELLRSNDREAEWLAIVPRGIESVVQELATLRQAQGLSTLVTTWDQVYSEFGNGRRSPFAVRDFINFAMESWNSSPLYLTLVGDSSYDPDDFFEYGNDTSKFSPLPMVAGQFVDFGSDHWYVATADSAHQLSIGRIPTSIPAEVEAYIAKVKSYENGSRGPNKTSSRQIDMIIDRDTLGEGFASLSKSLEQAASAINEELTFSSVDYKGLDADEFVQTIGDKFTGKPAFINYFGHGAEDSWSDSFTTAEVDALTNKGLPIVTAMNCLNAYYYDPDLEYRSLGERIIFNSGGGGIAFIGSSSLTMPTAQQRLAIELFEAFAQVTSQEYSVTRLGDLLTRAKVEASTSAGTEEAVSSFYLFGDPALTLPANMFKDPVVPDEPVPVTPVKETQEPKPEPTPEEKTEDQGSADETEQNIIEDLADSADGDHRPYWKKKLGCSSIGVLHTPATGWLVVLLLGIPVALTGIRKKRP